VFGEVRGEVGRAGDWKREQR